MPSFLTLPVEIRLAIYELAIQDSNELTIGTILSSNSDSAHRIPGLPYDHIPVVHNGLDEKLMDFTTYAPRTTISPPRTPAPASPSTTPSAVAAEMTRTNSYFGNIIPAEPPAGMPKVAPYALVATCKQIRDEFADYMGLKHSKPLKLHVSYPYGIIVLQHIYPTLLTKVASLDIGGFFTGQHTRADDSSIRPFTPATSGPICASISLETHNSAVAALLATIDHFHTPGSRKLCGPEIQMRFFSPSGVSYGTSNCEDSPLIRGVKQVGSGICEMFCYNGSGSSPKCWAVRMKGYKDDSRVGCRFFSSWPGLPKGVNGSDWLGLVSGRMPLAVTKDWGIQIMDLGEGL
ncbi:hypothetical protein BT63DRAFT_452409 [Microthyrium microscopicum]|uniref:Uncharacterized protein n=1 Tax=Microthyrium microscopicum TaxID=703497 RepID=A0A6A6ULW6_9PEZI|nr:hypothetical protein BT63DRAFT_452409 [Microthyrium microscopicum]